MPLPEPPPGEEGPVEDPPLGLDLEPGALVLPPGPPFVDEGVDWEPGALVLLLLGVGVLGFGVLPPEPGFGVLDPPVPGFGVLGGGLIGFGVLGGAGVLGGW